MSFEDWMFSEGLSEASVQKYYTAIKGVMSDWAKKDGIISGSLLDITDHAVASLAVEQIENLNIFKERDSIGNGMYSAALKKYLQYLYLNFANVENDIETIISDSNIRQTEKINLVNARIGQGQFRKNLISMWKCCSVTGYQNIPFLVASHIKPWKTSTNKERLDQFNGFLLLPNLDKAFDKGLISFDLRGHIIISDQLQNPNKLGIYPNMTIKLSEQHKHYLEYHLDYIFKRARKDE